MTSVSETTSEIEIECVVDGDALVASVRPEAVELIWSERTAQHLEDLIS